MAQRSSRPFLSGIDHAPAMGHGHAERSDAYAERHHKVRHLTARETSA